MRLRDKFLSVLALACLAPVAHAQYYYGSLPDDRPVRWYVMGGYSQPVGYTNQVLQGGYDVGFGMQLRQPGNPLSLRVELNYANNNAAHGLIDQGESNTGLNITGGWADIWSLTANGQYEFPIAPAVHGYLMAGGGGYYTSVSLTSYGYGYVCDPWWGYCYPAYGNVVVAQNDVTKWGWNAGAGVSFRLRGGTQLFVEARYTEIELPEKFQYIPIVIGFKF
jgi:opacity protein-like surface antigen